MRNFVQMGDVVTVTSPATVSSGNGVLIGTLFGVAATDAESGRRRNQDHGRFHLAEDVSPSLDGRCAYLLGRRWMHDC
jgi:predicted RecA/RadA family phage recombinase